MAKSLNRVQLIGNLTRDPELRYTPTGTAVCTFGIATNRSWTTESGEKKEEADFHRIVAWNKLAELCSQFLIKGRKIYVEGRLSTRSWTAQDGQQRSATEVVIDDMILLDSKRPDVASEGQVKEPMAAPPQQPIVPVKQAAKRVQEKQEETEVKPETTVNDEEVSPDDIPF